LEKARTFPSFGFTALLHIVVESVGSETNKQMETHNSYISKRSIKFILMLYSLINKKSVKARIFMCHQSQLDFITLSNYNKSSIRITQPL